MLRRDCINFLTCGGLEITQVRDPFFAIDHELAFMPVCGTCFDEYMSLDPSMGYYEIPMVDTQIKTDDITLRFSDVYADEYRRVTYRRGLMGRAAVVVCDRGIFASTDILVFSETIDAGNKFAAKTIGSYKFMPIELSRQSATY